MTKDEIKTLITEKISGQGNQVDIGGALDDVLNGIVDSLVDAPQEHIITVENPDALAGEIVLDGDNRFSATIGDIVKFNILSAPENDARAMVIGYIKGGNVAFPNLIVSTFGDDNATPTMIGVFQS